MKVAGGQRSHTLLGIFKILKEGKGGTCKKGKPNIKW